MFRTLRLTIAYDGTRYAGWQVQEGAGGRRPTIQGALEAVLSRILRERIKVVGSGRTDAGVHAEGQVAHLRTKSGLPCRRLLQSVNALLPAYIAVLSIEDASPGFHARFHAKRKRYRYRIFIGPVVPPFIRPYVQHVCVALDVALMRREAARLVGRHDFRGFARAGSVRGKTVRRITAASVVRRGQEIQIDVEGSGFLHTMVRSIAGTLIDIGRGRLAAGTMQRLVARRDRELCGTVAPARGLTLMCVNYDA
jgi:tRNA pseudouridine38-40 synthase